MAFDSGSEQRLYMLHCSQSILKDLSYYSELFTNVVVRVTSMIKTCHSQARTAVIVILRQLVGYVQLLSDWGGVCIR